MYRNTSLFEINYLIKMPIEVRKATLNDLPVLQKVCFNTYTQNFSYEGNKNVLDRFLHQEFSTEQLKQELTSPETDYFLISKNNQPVGFFKVIDQPSTVQEKVLDCLTMDQGSMLPNQRHPKISQFVFDQLITLAEERAKKGLIIQVSNTNERGLRLCEKNGFTRIARTLLTLPFLNEEQKEGWTYLRRM